MPRNFPTEKDLIKFLESAKPLLHDKLLDELYEFNSIKFQLAVQ